MQELHGLQHHQRVTGFDAVAERDTYLNGLADARKAADAAERARESERRDDAALFNANLQKLVAEKVPRLAEMWWRCRPPCLLADAWWRWCYCCASAVTPARSHRRCSWVELVWLPNVAGVVA